MYDNKTAWREQFVAIPSEAREICDVAMFQNVRVRSRLPLFISLATNKKDFVLDLGFGFRAKHIPAKTENIVYDCSVVKAELFSDSKNSLKLFNVPANIYGSPRNYAAGI